MITLVDFIDEQIKFFGIEDTTTNRNRLRKKFTRTLQELGYWDNAKTTITSTKPAKLFTDEQIMALKIEVESYLLNLSTTIDYNNLEKIVHNNQYDRGYIYYTGELFEEDENGNLVEGNIQEIPKYITKESFFDKLNEDEVIKAMIKAIFFEKFELDAEAWYRDQKFIDDTEKLIEGKNPEDYFLSTEESEKMLELAEEDEETGNPIFPKGFFDITESPFDQYDQIMSSTSYALAEEKLKRPEQYYIKKKRANKKQNFSSTNKDNLSTLKGTLVEKPRIYLNKDGSRKIIITLAVKRNFRNKNGIFETDFIKLQDFLPSNNSDNGPYDNLSKGDIITVTSEDRSSIYTNSEGKKVYTQFKYITSLQIEKNKK